MDKEVFDKKRFINLCRQYIGKEYKEYLALWIKVTVIFAVCGFLFNYFMGNYSSYSTDKSSIFFDFVFRLIICASVISKSMNAFSEYRNREMAVAWMLLPGSIIEKYLSRLLFSLPIVFIILYISYFLGFNLGKIASAVIFQRSYFLYIPLNYSNYPGFTSHSLLKDAIMVINLHAVFFAGGLFFKKHPFIKTSLTVAVISLCITIIFSSFGGLAFVLKTSSEGGNYYLLNNYWPDIISKSFKLLYYCIIPLSCWIISFYKLKAKQMI